MHAQAGAMHELCRALMAPSWISMRAKSSQQAWYKSRGNRPAKPHHATNQQLRGQLLAAGLCQQHHAPTGSFLHRPRHDHGLRMHGSWQGRVSGHMGGAYACVGVGPPAKNQGQHGSMHQAFFCMPRTSR